MKGAPHRGQEPVQMFGTNRDWAIAVESAQKGRAVPFKGPRKRKMILDIQNYIELLEENARKNPTTTNGAINNEHPGGDHPV